jgi:hypothetical protein
VATGKTHIRFFRFLVDGVDLSGDSRAVGSFGESYAEVPVHGWSEWGVYNVLDRASHTLTGYQAVFNTTAATGSYVELSALEEYVTSIFMGIRAAPIVGVPAFSSSFEQLTSTVEAGEGVLINAEFRKAITDSDHTHAFGVALAIGAALTATTNGTSVDNGAATALGALAHLHITASSGGGWTYKVQDSPDDAAWGDLITFAADGSAVLGERGDVAAAATTPDRYTRFQATRASGTCTAWCTLVRQ